ncbi:hypothetical protein Tco_0968277 [Tanacetum coccineum]
MVGSLCTLQHRPDLVLPPFQCARYQASLPKKHLKYQTVFRYLKGPLTWVFGIERHAMSIKLMQMRIMRDVKIQEGVRREVLSFLEINWLASHQRSNEARQYQLQRLNTLPCLDVVLKSFGLLIPAQRLRFDFNKIPLYCDTKSLLLFAVTPSSTLALNTLDIRHISSECKWKLEWLNFTSWKRIITCQTSSPKQLPRVRSNFFSMPGMKSIGPLKSQSLTEGRMSKPNAFVYPLYIVPKKKEKKSFGITKRLAITSDCNPV